MGRLAEYIKYAWRMILDEKNSGNRPIDNRQSQDKWNQIRLLKKIQVIWRYYTIQRKRKKNKGKNNKQEDSTSQRILTYKMFIDKTKN